MIGLIELAIALFISAALLFLSVVWMSARDKGD